MICALSACAEPTSAVVGSVIERIVSIGESDRAVVVACGLIRRARGLNSLGIFILRIWFQGCESNCFEHSHCLTQ